MTPCSAKTSRAASTTSRQPALSKFESCNGETVRKAQEGTITEYINKNAQLIQENEILKNENDTLRSYYNLAKELVNIFIEHGIRADLTQEEIELVKELAK